MAIGVASLLGFRITRNFNYPFFARSIPEFWRRWHISLTGWFTDYVFTPLNIYLREYGKAGLILAILINFVAIGIWHGANWTFILFGFLHGCFYIPPIIRGAISKSRNHNRPLTASISPKGFISVIGTFALLMLTFVIFRANSVPQAFDYYRRLFSPSIFVPFTVTEKVNTIATLAAIIVMLWAEWLQRDKQHALQIDAVRRFPARALIYFSLIFIILFFSPPTITDFIYFKF
jgi:D-alanyl-lipoteichoic acid acyltransferase DltB (MBOAT superfamily)